MQAVNPMQVAESIASVVVVAEERRWQWGDCGRSSEDRNTWRRLCPAGRQARDSRSSPVLVDDHHALLVFDTSYVVDVYILHLVLAAAPCHPAVPPCRQVACHLADLTRGGRGVAEPVCQTMVPRLRSSRFPAFLSSRCTN